MLVRVDQTAREPLFRQIAGQIRAAIGDGELVTGERLPTARELADGLGVNMHTVLRAYAELRDEGLVEMRRRRGVIVRDAGPGKARLHDLADQLRTEARRQGMALPDLHALLKEIW